MRLDSPIRLLTPPTNNHFTLPRHCWVADGLVPFMDHRSEITRYLSCAQATGYNTQERALIKRTNPVASVDTLESRREQLTERFFKGAFYGNRPVYTTCCRTNGTQPSQTDYVMRKRLHHSPLELKNVTSHVYRTV